MFYDTWCHSGPERRIFEGEMFEIWSWQQLGCSSSPRHPSPSTGNYKRQKKKGRKNDELQPTNDENDEMTKQLGHPSPSTGNYLVTKRQKTKRQKKRQEGRPDKRQKDKMTKLETNPRQQKKCCNQPFRIYHCNCATLRRPQSRQLLIFILESGNQSIDQIYCTVYFIS